MSKLIKGNNDFATLFPELLQEWDYNNNTISPDGVTAHSGKEVWWICKKGHEWVAPIHSRTGNAHSGCPYCSNKKIIKGYNDLESSFPQLAQEWNYNKNEMLPNEVACHSGKSVWWMCTKGHEWKATICSRTGANATGCPYCSNKQVLKGYNDLATTDPDLIYEWCFSANTTINPDEVTAGSKMKVTWQCHVCDNLWIAAIQARTRGEGCPICAKKNAARKLNEIRIQQRGTVVAKSPLLLSEWNYSRNNSIDPQKVLCGSEQKVWWICSKGHEWESTVKDRKKNNCPFCSNKKVLSGYNDLATTNPSLASEWHPTKNGLLTPSSITAGSNKSVWWLCKKGHEWRATINSRNKGRGCRQCSEEISTSFPEQALLFYMKQIYTDAINRYDKEGFEIDVYIPQYRIGIEYDGHYYHDTVMRDIKKDTLALTCGISLIRIREPKCPELNSSSIIVRRNTMTIKGLEDAIRRTISIIGELVHNNTIVDIDILRDEISIENLTEKTYKPKSLIAMFPEIAKEWNSEKNGRLRPEQISYGSTRSVWWRCNTCGYEWKASINSRTNGNEKNKRGCPKCGKKHGIESFNQTIIKRNGSLEEKHPWLLAEWDYESNSELMPNQVSPNSKKYLWWICSKGHRWQATVDNRVRGHGCPYCANKKVLAGYNDLATTNPGLSSEWDYKKNGDFKPTMVTKGSQKSAWWQCEYGHEWQAKINARSRGTGCPFCWNQRQRKSNDEEAFFK